MSYLVLKKMIRAKTIHNGIAVPSAIAISCPHCSDYLTYFCRDYMRHPPTDTITFVGWCPSCEGKINFWMNNSRDYDNAVILMYPALPGFRDVMKGIEYIPKKIADNYIEALETYRHHYYKASTTMIRACLEGVFKSISDEHDIDNLADVLVSAAQKIDLAAKIEDIADVIRKGENLKPHFALDCKPEQHIAENLLDFMEFVLQYVYVMPEEAKNLKDHMSNLKQKVNPPPCDG